MRIHPAVSALRGSPDLQRRPTEPAPVQKSAAALEQVAEEWRARRETRSVAQDLKRYGAGVNLRDCANLSALMGDLGQAQAFTHSLIQTILPALHSHALGEAPFRFKNSQGLATIQLSLIHI